MFRNELFGVYETFSGLSQYKFFIIQLYLQIKRKNNLNKYIVKACIKAICDLFSRVQLVFYYPNLMKILPENVI